VPLDIGGALVPLCLALRGTDCATCSTGLERALMARFDFLQCKRASELDPRRGEVSHLTSDNWHHNTQLCRNLGSNSKVIQHDEDIFLDSFSQSIRTSMCHDRQYHVQWAHVMRASLRRRFLRGTYYQLPLSAVI
jgi:hypothetical protein